MSEYETANLALEQAALAATYWQTGLSAVLSLLTLAVSSGLVLYGFRLMGRGTEQRAGNRPAPYRIHDGAPHPHQAHLAPGCLRCLT